MKTKEQIINEFESIEEQIRTLKNRSSQLLNHLVENHAPHQKGDFIEDRRGNKLQVSHVIAIPHSSHGAIWQIHGFKIRKDGKTGSRRDYITSRI